VTFPINKTKRGRTSFLLDTSAAHTRKNWQPKRRQKCETNE